MDDFEITPEQFAEKISKQEEYLLLDVREPQELAIADVTRGTRLPGLPFLHIPMGSISQRFQELDPDQPIVVMCHHGMRSAQVTAYLRQQGFSRVKNLKGGIDRWSVLVDGSVPRY
jgi:adenylyltransferase/sulfurtransferase